MTWTVGFAEIDGDMLASVGGKGANLGVLTRAGLPVPPGFCVTTDAYKRVAGADHTNARERLLNDEIPAEIVEEITEAYQALGENVPVAVRSSATAEDLPFASFAGQQDTYLNIIGAEAVLAATRNCWASLWTDRAVAYRATNGIDEDTVRLAVVIQRMVQSDVAGVMFTANPVTGRRHQYVIDAGPGLGEAVVSGAVNPDHFVVTDNEITERRIGDKRIVIRSRPEGGTEQIERTGTDPCLTDDQILALARLGAATENHYKSPQDTEWAIENGELWLTQARPITTLYPLPTQTAEDTRAYFSFSIAQGLYRPITPSGLAAIRLIASSASKHIVGYPVRNPFDGPPMVLTPGQRVFIDVTDPIRSTVGRMIVPKVLDVMEARSAKILKGLFDDPRFSLKYTSRRKFLRRLLKVALKYRVPLRGLRAIAAPDAAHRHVAELCERLRVKAYLPEPATRQQRIDHICRLLGGAAPVLPTVLPSVGAGFAMLLLARKLTGADSVQEVLRGLPHNITTEMDLELWQIATRIRANEEARARFLDTPPEWLRYQDLPDVGIGAFLEKWGHRAVAEIDLGMPRWADDPTHILGVLANYLRLDDPDLAPDRQFARGAAAAQATIDRLAGQARVKWMARFAFDRARRLIGLREMPKYYLIVALDAVRRQLLKLGEELVATGRVARVEDVFFLDFQEMLGEHDLRHVITGRRAAYDLELRCRRLPRVLLSDGTEPEALTQAPATDGLVGTPASAGTVTGTARVVLDPVGAHLEPGEILVAPSTDPGWTPLFLTAGGLVMEMGGPNSHGAVVAREYGIPAVVGVADATHRITTGQTITVDGATGAVVQQFA
ncbi:PEP/pyruvate-binding domain-containing protein [Allosalinactinospora lopnorensis]|uniref:PEP/pyruvate-binding domain-containing protein n=1 Tax=Allosalinactinospora lopnorensis TaxID=1352348 RepID=UPI000623DF7F|nr:PEP/pyruvate-binding domain-containing protein [Allosalinactinospora lopnorensis]